MPKYFVRQGIAGLEQVELDGALAHHLLRVLRVRSGDLIILCDGQGTDYDGVVEQITSGGRSLWVRITARRPCETEPAVRVTLYQALPKGDKMEWIIQKCVELGVHAIVPIITERTVVRVKEGQTKTTRYQRIAESAAEQSMRGIIPHIGEPLSLSDAIAAAREDTHLVAYENEKQQTIKQALQGEPMQTIGLWVGPEGGFSEAEVLAFQARSMPAITLGRRILRTETAGMAGLVQILCVTEAQ